MVEDGYFPIIINAQNKQSFAPEFIKITNNKMDEILSLPTAQLQLKKRLDKYGVSSNYNIP